MHENPALEFAWPRADFAAASREFMIGLLSTICPPEETEHWEDWWNTPPSSDELHARFAALDEAFQLDAEGTRFLQDRMPLDAEPSPVSGLLIESPGANTERLNLDLFQKRRRVGTLSRSAAAMALFTLQTYAPSGGAGHRTSMRGGGPLTTLALPRETRPTLWHTLWLNVLKVWSAEDGEPSDTPLRVFPWLAPTRTSERGAQATSLGDAHPAQVFWGMPRRIRLDFEPNVDAVPCDLTGVVDDVVVRTYRTRPYGVNYADWLHPLSPYYRQKASDPHWLPTHPQPGGVTYRHWIEMASGGDPLRRPATCIVEAKRRLGILSPGLHDARILAAGYDMDNMKARSFVEVEMPLLIASRTEELDALARRLVQASAEVASLAARAVRNAQHGEGAKVDQGATPFASVREMLFAETETVFFATLREAAQILEEDIADENLVLRIGHSWLDTTLRPTAQRLFDHAAPLIDPAEGQAERIITARRDLNSALYGYGKRGKALFDVLGLQPPEQGKARTRKHETAHV